MLPLLAVVLGLTPLAGSSMSDLVCPPTNGWQLVLILTILFGCLPSLILVVVFAFRIRRYEQDGFFIKRELAQTALSWIVFTIGILSAQLAISDQYWQLVVTNVFWTLLLVSFHVVSLLLPTLASYKFERLQNETRSAMQTMSLQQFLTIPAGVDTLLHFLRKEFCSESLMFWQSVAAFKTRFGFGADKRAAKQLQMLMTAAETRQHMNEALRVAHDIFDQYLRATSPFEVNISGALRARVRQQLVNIEQQVGSQKDLATSDGAVAAVSAVSEVRLLFLVRTL